MKLSEKKGGGLIYTLPERRTYNGSNQYSYSGAITTSGNKTYGFAFGKWNEITGAGGLSQYLLRLDGPGDQLRLAMLMNDGDASDTELRNKIRLRITNSAGTIVCDICSTTVVCGSGKFFFLFGEYDGDAGTARLVVAELGKPPNEEDNLSWGSRVAPTTATLDTGASSQIIIGEASASGGSRPADGEFGYLGCNDGVANWRDFVDRHGFPKHPDTTNWTEFGGSQPFLYQRHGDAGNNDGSATFTVVNSPGIAETTETFPIPMIGLPTIGTAGTEHILTGKTAWVDGVELVGNAYTPAMMEFDGSTSYFTATYTSVGNKVTIVGSFAINSFTGTTAAYYLFRARGPVGQGRAEVLAISSDFTTDTNKQDCVQFQSRNSAGTSICLLLTEPIWLDGNRHTYFYEFDGDNGDATLIIDGVNADDTGNPSRIAPTTGTLDTGASSQVQVGAANTTPTNVTDGDLGFIGMRDVDGLDWTDFMYPDGRPKNIDATLSTVWGGSPLLWNPHGDMANNLGSIGAMTKGGTIIVGNGGST